jgi:hypothetical protein
VIFNAQDHARLATLFTCAPPHPDARGAFPPYAGYRPEVREAPNGDTRECEQCSGIGRARRGSNDQWEWPCKSCKGAGRVPNTDVGKRYLHVAPKYLDKHPGLEWPREYLARAHYEACRVAEALGVPDAYYPRVENGTLRVLEYPAGAGTAEHTDFNLFTVLCYRSHPADLELSGARGTTRAASDVRIDMSPGLHIGEIGELVGLGPATPHHVPARPYAQQSIVYFALPANGAWLPTAPGRVPCVRVAEWLAERLARSRY